MDAPVRYARSGGVYIAYRTFGDGPRDIVLVPGSVSHVELYWELPTNAYILKRLASFARVIVFDKRGQGLSDRVAELTLEERITDVRAVMDAAGSERATIYGWSEGGSMSLMFAATYPERTTSVVLYGSYPSVKATREAYAEFLDTLEKHWGEGVLVALTAPSRREDEAFVQWFGRLERAVASPGGIVALMRANYEIDVRHLLPSIHVPTLILHREGDSLVPVGAGRHLAKHIPGAKYVELPGVDHLLQALDQELLDVLLDEIEEFITGTRRRPEPDRVLATVMFVDIVGSTQRAAELGDRRWLALLQSYHAVVQGEVSAFRGREVNTAGDGLVAAFDGPARAVRCARSVRDRVRPLGVDVRIGLHTGECELLGDRLGGIALHIGARVASAAGAGEVLVSSTVRELVAGSGLRFADRGMHDLKGVPGEWHLFAAE
jgi:pimeloyl-ACP methyl ester carboxylesterase